MMSSKTLVARFVRHAIAISALAIAAAGPAHADSAQQTLHQFDIPAQSTSDALNAFSKQSGLRLLFSYNAVEGMKAGAIRGNFSAEEVLKKILNGTGLSYQISPDGVVLIRGNEDGVPGAASKEGVPPPVSPRTSNDQGARVNREKGADAERSDASSSQSKAEELEEVTVHMPEILVKGAKTLNMDIKRTKDDPLPYVVFDRQMIEKSGARNLEDFLKNRLPMNTQQATNGQTPANALGNRSQINLRGLGAGQTLILIDGHRTSNAVINSGVAQADINGIPINAVERIEVLPTTASGIYGGSATGGVVNIIMRKDYSGLETKLSYGNTFDTDVASRRVDVAGGLNLEGGKTNILVAGSWSDGSVLTVGDRRDFYERSTGKILANTGGDLSTVSASQYGTPGLGTTPNIKSADGTPLLLDNGTALNSLYTYIPNGYAGTATDNGAALIGNAGRQNLGLANTMQVFTGAGQQLFSAPTTASAMATIQRQFSPGVRAFLELSASRNKTESQFGVVNTSGFAATRIASIAPNNPFQQDIFVSFPVPEGTGSSSSLTEDLRGVGGVVVDLPGRWMAGVDYTWDQTKYQSSRTTSAGGLSSAATALIGSGGLDVLKDTNLNPIDFTPYLSSGSVTTRANQSTMKDASVRAAGPVASLPGGEVRISTQLAYREDIFGGYEEHNAAGVLTYLNPDRSQSALSAYLEASIPLVSSKNRMRGVEALELLLSGRYESLEVNGSTQAIFNPTPSPVVSRQTGESSSIDPTIALRWQPIQDVAVRMSWGTGFLPPSVFQVVRVPGNAANNPNITNISSGPDPRRGDTASPLNGPGQLVEGGNPDLVPETSENISAGIILTPRFIPNLRLSVDYTRIKKSDNISGFPGSRQEYITFIEQYYPERIQRGPKLTTDPADWAGPIVFLDATLLNLALADVEAYDVQLDYRVDTASVGTFDFFGIGSLQTHYETQPKTGLPITEGVGYPGGPLKVKANGGVSWNLQNWSAQWVSRYFDSYRIDRNPLSNNVIRQGSLYVGDQVYHDVAVSYRPTLSSWGSVLKDSEITFGVKNLFNKKPPFQVGGGVATLGYSTYGDVYLANYYLTLKTSF